MTKGLHSGLLPCAKPGCSSSGCSFSPQDACTLLSHAMEKCLGSETANRHFCFYESLIQRPLKPRGVSTRTSVRLGLALSKSNGSILPYKPPTGWSRGSPMELLSVAYRRSPYFLCSSSSSSPSQENCTHPFPAKPSISMERDKRLSLLSNFIATVRYSCCPCFFG